jgi:hypothetical protein
MPYCKTHARHHNGDPCPICTAKALADKDARIRELEEAGDALMAWDNNLLTAPGIAPEYRAAVQRFGDVLGVPAEDTEK